MSSKNSLIPLEWSERRQGDVAGFSNGRAYKLTEWEKQGVPVIRLQNLTGSGKEFYYSNLELPERQYCGKGDLLYMWSATFGPHIWSGPQAIYHYHIWKVTCDEVNLTKPYLYQLLGYKTEEWLNKSNGMGILHVTKGGMEDLPLLLPPLPEQQKIAAILSSVDEVIEKTEVQIQKLKDLKTAMMQALLTKGIGHTEFKDSPVGRIPVGWRVAILGDLIKSMQGGVSVNGENREKAQNEIGVLKVSSVFQGKFIPHKHKAVISKDVDRARLNPMEGYILFSRANTPALVGECGYIEKTYSDLFLPDKLWMIDVKDRSKTNVRWLTYVLSSGRVRKLISDVATGTSGSMKNISKPSLLGIQVAFPAFDEQTRITKYIHSVDLLLESSIERHKRNKALKKALMQDLLTGKVRVNVDQATKEKLAS